MINGKKARKLLGDYGGTLTDEQVQKITNALYVFAKIHYGSQLWKASVSTEESESQKIITITKPNQK